MFVSYMFDIIVMGLLATTITFAYILNARLRKLRDHEGELRASVAELYNASQKVETAVKALKTHNSRPLEQLKKQSESAEEAAIELHRQMADAKKLLNHLQTVLKTAKANGVSNDVLLSRSEERSMRQSSQIQGSQAHRVQTPRAPSLAETANNRMQHMPEFREQEKLRPSSAPANMNASRREDQYAQMQGYKEEQALNRLQERVNQPRRGNNGRAA